MDIQSEQDILSIYNDKKDSRFIYVDKNMDNRGIDYKKFLKLRHSSINNLHIKNHITINGWYMLWYLMSNAQQGTYIITTLDFISQDLKIKIQNIKEILIHLQNDNIILIKENLKQLIKTDRIHIAIIYNNNELYKKYIDNNTSFDPIPTELVQTIIPNITPNQWIIYTTLCTYFNYYNVKESYNEEKNKTIYSLSENCYAFPTQEKISELTGLTEKTIKINIEKLCNNNFKLINERASFNDTHIHYIDKYTGKNKIKRMNKTYDVILYQRLEYVYYCIIQMQDNRDIKIQELIKTKGFDEISKSSNYKILRSKDYIVSRYGEFIKQYEECLKNKDIEGYKKLRNEKIQK